MSITAVRSSSPENSKTDRQKCQSFDKKLGLASKALRSLEAVHEIISCFKRNMVHFQGIWLKWVRVYEYSEAKSHYTAAKMALYENRQVLGQPGKAEHPGTYSKVELF